MFSAHGHGYYCPKLHESLRWTLIRQFQLTDPYKASFFLTRRLEFHYTPEQGSWLNIAETELAVLSNSCLSQRIPDKDSLRRKAEANVRERNLKAMPVNWRFTTQEVRRKLARLYPCVSACLTRAFMPIEIKME
jgi:hypothetical protein